MSEKRGEPDPQPEPGERTLLGGEAPTVVVFTGGSPPLGSLLEALSEAGVRFRVLGRREQVLEAKPRVVVVDLHGYPDPWNDVRVFGLDPRLAGTRVFLFAEALGRLSEAERRESRRRFSRAVAQALRTY